MDRQTSIEKWLAAIPDSFGTEINGHQLHSNKASSFQLQWSHITPPTSDGTTSPSRTTRSKSPVKNNNSLQVLDVPINPLELEGNGLDLLQPDVHELYEGLQDINDKERFIPGPMKDSIKSTEKRAKDHWFIDERGTDGPEILVALNRELQVLHEIRSEAKQCKLSDCSEASWNMHVHMPLLKYALSGHSTVRIEPGMSAKIAAPFLPTANGKATVVESKMVDFTLLLCQLIAGIATHIWNQPPEAQFVNQSLYAPLQFAPIACSIESKTSTSPNQGKLQLSVWTAAWFKRISELLPNHKPPTIPLIHVVGHEWHISFASFHGTHIEVAEELAIGDTRTIIGLYQLIASLRKLGDWIETQYRAWAEEVFLQSRETTAQ
ncbi:hypothetical protein BKA59DRAFT_532484 [Fusarium tricinctum]|uniref:PD-(D/E)XK nuclease-like domain-containing protein n=1 Tax=Fusarium tricinctum TaxID=61284 RepID=A0A8K0W7M9_9HYPO|nr:hypothetical protein BKA59DRAFT_532484 [Fusarium tricinctum]